MDEGFKGKYFGENREMRTAKSLDQIDSWGVSRSGCLKSCISDIFDQFKLNFDKESIFCKTVSQNLKNYTFADLEILQKEHSEHIQKLKKVMETAIKLDNSPKLEGFESDSQTSGKASSGKRMSILGLSPADGGVRGARLSESGFDKNEGTKTTYLMMQELKGIQRETTDESKFAFKKNNIFFDFSQEITQESEGLESKSTDGLSSPRKLFKKYLSNQKFEHISSVAPILTIITSGIPSLSGDKSAFNLNLHDSDYWSQVSVDGSPVKGRGFNPDDSCRSLSPTKLQKGSSSPLKPQRSDSPSKMLADSPTKNPRKKSDMSSFGSSPMGVSPQRTAPNFFTKNIEKSKFFSGPVAIAKKLAFLLQSESRPLGLRNLLEPWPCKEDKELKTAEYVFKFEFLRIAQKVCRVPSLSKTFELLMLKISQFLMVNDESPDCPIKDFSETVLPALNQKLYGKNVDFCEMVSLQILSNFFSLVPMNEACKTMGDLTPILSQGMGVPPECVEMSLTLTLPQLFDHFIRILPRDELVFTHILEFHSLFGMPTVIPKLLLHKKYLDDPAIRLSAVQGFLCLDRLFGEIIINYDELIKIFRIFLFGLKVFFELVKEELLFPSFPEYMKHKLMLTSLKMLRSQVNLEFISENLSEIQPLEIIKNLRHLLQSGNEEFIAIIAVFLEDINESGQMNPYDEFSRGILSSLLSIVKYLYIEEAGLSFGVEDIISAMEEITSIETCLLECNSTLKVGGVVEALHPAMRKAFQKLRGELTEIMDNCVKGENWESESEYSLHSTSILDFCSMMNESINLVLNLTTNKEIRMFLLDSFEVLIEEITGSYGRKMAESLLVFNKGRPISKMAEYKAMEFPKRLPKLPKDKKMLDFSHIINEYVNESAKLKNYMVRLWNLEFLEAQIGSIVKTYFDYKSDKLMNIVSVLKKSASACISIVSELINSYLFEPYILVYLYQDMTKRMLLPSKEKEVQENLVFSIFSYGKVLEDFEVKIDQLAPRTCKEELFAEVYACFVDSYGCYLLEMFKWHHWNRHAMKEFVKLECDVLYGRASELTLKYETHPKKWESFNLFMGHIQKMMQVYVMNPKEINEMVLKEKNPTLQAVFQAIKGLKK